MPNKAPRFKLRWWVLRVFSAVIALLLGVSSFFWGIVMMDGSEGNKLKEFGVLLCCVLGLSMVIAGVVCCGGSSLALSDEYSARIERRGPIEW